jgi:hypothetical protein
MPSSGDTIDEIYILSQSIVCFIVIFNLVFPWFLFGTLDTLPIECINQCLTVLKYKNNKGLCKIYVKPNKVLYLLYIYKLNNNKVQI